jgi:hypothetical protein
VIVVLLALAGLLVLIALAIFGGDPDEPDDDDAEI